MAEGISVRLTSVPAVGPDIQVPDVKDASDFASYATPGPLLVPVPGSVEVEYTSRVATSLEAGGIHELILASQLTYEFVLAPAFLAAVGVGLDLIADETPTGAIDGVNTAYTLGAVPLTFAGLYLNGQKLIRGGGNDYTIAGAAITMTVAPGIGETLRADYIQTISGFTFEADEVPAGLINGANTAYTLANAPVTFVGLYLNGIKQINPDDYTRVGTAITMIVAPVALDTLVVDYIY